MQHATNITPFSRAAVPDDIAAVIDAEFIANMVGEDLTTDCVAPDAAVESVAAEPAPVITLSATCDRASLASAVNRALRVVKRRNTMPILANVLLRAVAGLGGGTSKFEGGCLQVVGTDLDSEICITVPADIDAGFAVTVPGHYLHDALKKSAAFSPLRSRTTARQRRPIDRTAPWCSPR